MRSEVQVLLDPPYTSGALAQLVERLLCKQDVIGSNPIGSTTNTGIADMIRQHLLVLSRPVGRGSSEPFNIVQRDNQRRRSHPRKGVTGGSSELPAMTLSKSSTLTKSRYPCDIGGKSTCILIGRRVCIRTKGCADRETQVFLLPDQIKRDKGVWWMPWQ